MSKNMIVQVLELHPEVTWTVRLPTPEDPPSGHQRPEFVLDIVGGAVFFMTLDEAKEVLEYAAPTPEPKLSGIEITHTESHVVEYNTIVTTLLHEYNETGQLPESKAQCEDWVAQVLDFGDALLVSSDHPKRDEVEALVQSFYTDFDNRIW